MYLLITPCRWPLSSKSWRKWGVCWETASSHGKIGQYVCPVPLTQCHKSQTGSTLGGTEAGQELSCGDHMCHPFLASTHVDYLSIIQKYLGFSTGHCGTGNLMNYFKCIVKNSIGNNLCLCQWLLGHTCLLLLSMCLLFHCSCRAEMFTVQREHD